MVEKYCSKCDSIKDISKFYTDKNTRDGYRYMCIECTLAFNKKRPSQRKNTMLKYQFGINLEQYNEILVKQSFSCAICLKHQSEFKVGLSVDHCHASKKIRGLLCDPCNRGLGQFRDDAERLSRASEYVKEADTQLKVLKGGQLY